MTKDFQTESTGHAGWVKGRDERRKAVKWLGYELGRAGG